MTLFQELGLQEEILRALRGKGYNHPTQIQQEAIPAILEGNDLMAGSQTGTGKTASFVLPILQKLVAAGAKKGGVRALILVPTRELAAQVRENVRVYGQYLPLRSAAIFGGVNMKTQVNALRQGVDLLIATPGRLLDHVNQRTVDLSKVEVLVLDEADRMLDMGFIRDIRKILGLLPASRQSLLFSATFSQEIKGLAGAFLRSPKTIEVGVTNSPAELVSQVIHPVDQDKKRDLLSFLICSHGWNQVLVFTRTKHGADRLAKQLESDDIPSRALHGNKSQAARTKALAEFKKGVVRVLVATDIAARGIDIDQLPHVVNFELPNVPEDYVHRIGRTGRAGSVGEAISLVCIHERKFLNDIERLLKKKLPRVQIQGYEPSRKIEQEPSIQVQKRRPHFHQGQRHKGGQRSLKPRVR